MLVFLLFTTVSVLLIRHPLVFAARDLSSETRKADNTQGLLPERHNEDHQVIMLEVGHPEMPHDWKQLPDNRATYNTEDVNDITKRRGWGKRADLPTSSRHGTRRFLPIELSYVDDDLNFVSSNQLEPVMEKRRGWGKRVGEIVNRGDQRDTSFANDPSVSQSELRLRAALIKALAHLQPKKETLKFKRRGWGKRFDDDTIDDSHLNE